MAIGRLSCYQRTQKGRDPYVPSVPPVVETEYVPDPSFDDPSAWSFVGTGATVTGSQLRFINANIASSDTVPTITPVVGLEHEYSLTVSTYPGSPLKARILFGGVEIYNKDGTGTFTGTVTPNNTSGLIFQAQLVGQWFLDSISITTKE